MSSSSTSIPEISKSTAFEQSIKTESSNTRFRKLKKLGEGTYGEVFKSIDNERGNFVAVKRFKLNVLNQTDRDGAEEPAQTNTNKSGISAFILRELGILKELNHPNVISLLDIECTPNHVSGIFELLDLDLSSYMKNIKSADDPMSFISADLVKSYAFQLLKALSYIHSRSIMHRDVKPSNLLIDKQGVLKLADFGMARKRYSASADLMGCYSPEPGTMFYKAPEILIKTEKYSASVDVWAAGCVIAEMILGQPLFNGSTFSDTAQLFCILRTIGTPTQDNWPDLHDWSTKNKIELPAQQFKGQSLGQMYTKLSENVLALDLITKMLQWNPKTRISAKRALEHEYFMQKH